MEKSFIPIILGITGHRDIPKEDYEMLKKKIKEIIDELKRKYPSTPLIFLTPLAEGADRIGAMAAKENGIEYIVPLPMPIEEYKKDFNDEASLKEFDEFLNGAKDFFVIGSPEYKEKNNKEHNQGQVERNKLYENLGVYIVKHCSILIALWDGKVSSGQGGTADVVGYKLNGIPSEYMENTIKMDHAYNGTVYHIMTRRTRRTMNEKLPDKFINEHKCISEHKFINEHKCIILNKCITSDKCINADKCITVTKIYPPYFAEREDAEKEYNSILESMDKSNENMIKLSKN